MMNRLGFFMFSDDESSYMNLLFISPIFYNSRKFLTMVLPSGVNTLSGWNWMPWIS